MHMEHSTVFLPVEGPTEVGQVSLLETVAPFYQQGLVVIPFKQADTSGVMPPVSNLPCPTMKVANLTIMKLLKGSHLSNTDENSAMEHTQQV